METEWESAGKKKKKKKEEEEVEEEEEEEEERMRTGRYPPSKWRGGVMHSGFSSDGAEAR